VADVRGSIKRTTTHAAEPVTALDLRGTAGGQLITITGTIAGEGDDPGIDIRITGANIPLDEKLIAALPPKYAERVRRFRAAGRGDLVARIVQKPGVNLCENEFRIDVRDATVNHKEFPLPLEKVKGRLVVRVAASDPDRPIRPGDTASPLPDRDEIILDSFTAVHAGAAITLNGSKRPIPGSRDRMLTLHISGNNCPLDADLRAAVAVLGAGSVWDAFAPRGTVTFTADIDLIDRSPPTDRPDAEVPINPATDLRLTFNFSGPTVTPTFFPYELTDFTAWLEYKNGRVDVAHVAGRHGQTRVRLAEGDVRFYLDGVVWANLAGLEVNPLVADADLIRALPGRLGAGLESLKLRGGVELHVKHLVVLTPPDNPVVPPTDPTPVGITPASGEREPPESGPRARSAAAPLGGLTPPARHVVFRAQSLTSPTSPRPDPVVYWDAEVRLAGASLDTGVPWEQVFGALACRGRYEGTHQGLLRGAVWLDRAVIARQPLTRLSARIRGLPQQPDPARPGQFLPTELQFTDLAGDLFHGQVGGEARVALTDPVRFDLWLTATDVQLDEIAKHYKLGSDADLKGIAQAQLRLFNRPDPVTGALVTEGMGKIDVPTGRMYNLPILLDLVKLIKGQAPDKTAFEEAHAVFRIHGDRVKVEQVDLIGKAVCLGGVGELDTSGEYVKFDFYTIPSQVLARLINTPVGDLTAFLSKNLFKIKLTRENGELKYRPEPVPLVTEPARAAPTAFAPAPPRCSAAGSELKSPRTAVRGLYWGTDARHHSQPADLLGAGQGLFDVLDHPHRVARDRRADPGGGPDGAVADPGHQGHPAVHPQHAAVHDPGHHLFASCVVYGRLAHDNEVVAIKAAGVHLFTILKPALLLGTITTLLTAALYHTVIPRSQQILYQKLLEDPEELLYNMLRRDRCLRHPTLSYVIYVKDVQGRRLIDVVLKRRAKVKNPKTGEESLFGYDFVARAREAELRVDPVEGKLHLDPKRFVIYDENTSGSTGDTGAFQMDLPEGLNGRDRVRISAMTWDDLPVRLAALRQDLDVKEQQREQNRRDAEAQPHPDLRLLFAQHDRSLEIHANAIRRSIRNVEAEYYLRPALACGCLLFAILGCPVGIWANRADYLSTFVICFLPALFVYYPLLLAGSGMGKDGKLPLGLGCWAANIVVGIAAVVLNARLLRR
jgi:lipopolysaccharide export LptBFGC system permease protein LptF